MPRWKAWKGLCHPLAESRRTFLQGQEGMGTRISPEAKRPSCRARLYLTTGSLLHREEKSSGGLNSLFCCRFWLLGSGWPTIELAHGQWTFKRSLVWINEWCVILFYARLQKRRLLLCASQMSVKSRGSFPGLLAKGFILHLLCSITFCIDAALVPGSPTAIFCTCGNMQHPSQRVCRFLLW